MTALRILNGFDDPKFVFIDPMKCHIPSNRISRMPSASFAAVGVW
jgi:hypothetical protein